jgi:hypothetical protein
MSKYKSLPNFVACIPNAIEPHWDNFWAPRLAGFPVNIVCAAKVEGVGLALAIYVFDPDTFVQNQQSRQMRYRPTVDSDFSLVVVLHQEGRIETFKHRGSEIICEACGPDFQTAMIHAAACGLAPDEPWTTMMSQSTEW